MKFKLGETYICTKSKLSYLTEGKEYPVIVTEFGKLAIRDDSETLWFDHQVTRMPAHFKLKEDTIYTKTEVIRQFTNAYQHFKTDAERLAYLKGYFTK